MWQVKLEVTHSITDSAGTSWCYGLVKGHEYATQDSIKSASCVW